MNKNNKKLSIVFLDLDDIKNPLLGAGQAKATLEVGKRLAKKGHSILVLCSKYPGYKDRKENGIFYKHIGVDTGNIKINNILYIFFVLNEVRKLKNADIIIECFTAPISTMFSPLFTKIPVVGLPTSFEADRFAKLYHLPFDKIERLGLRFYKYFLPYTKDFDKKMKSVNKSVVTKIVPEGVESDYFKIKKNKPKHILFLGRFDIGQKGIDLLLNSYAKISSQIKYPLVIAGFGIDEEKIKKMITELNLSKKVKIVGKAYGKKKFQLFSDSLFVAFSSRHEGFSLFSLEALASGLPLAAFDIPGLSWANSSVVLKAKKFNIDDYSQILLKMSDEKIATVMGKNAREFVRKYTWENVADEFESFFYKKVLKRN